MSVCLSLCVCDVQSSAAVAEVHMYMQVCVFSSSHTQTHTRILSHLGANELSGVKFKCVVECESYSSSLPITSYSENCQHVKQ